MKQTLKPLKRFGQHFLINKNIILKIIGAVDASVQDCILEIGSGDGALTFPLAQKAKNVVAVDIDRGRCQALAEAAKNTKNLKIVCSDILKFDLKSFSRRSKIKTFKVVGNLPYYLTTPILEHLFKYLGVVDDIFIMVQKEVAQRLTAHPNTKAYGSLTCFVNYFCCPKVLFKIKSGSFWPRPKIESCFVQLKPHRIPQRKCEVKSELLFFKVVRTAFGQRRKQLYSSLSRLLDRNKLKELGCRDLLSQRPQQLTLEDFAAISNHIFDIQGQ